MTHAIGKDRDIIFKVSEETTGHGIDGTWADTEAEAEEFARAVLTRKAAKLPDALKGLAVLNPAPTDGAASNPPTPNPFTPARP